MTLEAFEIAQLLWPILPSDADATTNKVNLVMEFYA